MSVFQPATLNKCFIGVIDLLGYRNRVMSTPIEVLVEEYQSILEKRKTLPSWEERYSKIVKIKWFSDLFLFNPNIEDYKANWDSDNDINSFYSIEYSVRYFFSSLLLSNIPARGAISYGELYCDDKLGIIIGKGYLEAFKAQENLRFISLCLTKSCIDNHPDFRKDDPQYAEYRNPPSDYFYDSNLGGPCYQLNTHFMQNDTRKNLVDFLRSSLGFSEKIAEKYRNTLSWIGEKEYVQPD
jgi:hypothetical protein